MRIRQLSHALVDWALPALGYLRTRSQIKPYSTRSEDEWVTCLSTSEMAQWAKDVYFAELERLRGIEDKLRNQLAYATALSPFLAGAIALSVDRSAKCSLVVELLAGIELLCAFLLSSLGAAPRKTFLVTSQDVYESPSTDLAARAMVATEANAPLAIRLQNAVDTASSSIRRAFLLLIVVGVLLLVHR